jgi:hypothetical protein
VYKNTKYLINYDTSINKLIDYVSTNGHAIFTETNVIPEDKNSEQYGARTDSRTDVIKTTPWFYFPYLGKMKIKYILYITGL